MGTLGPRFSRAEVGKDLRKTCAFTGHDAHETHLLCDEDPILLFEFGLNDVRHLPNGHKFGRL